MLLVDESFVKLGKSCYFIKFDVNSGFWWFFFDEKLKLLIIFVILFG